MASRSFSSRSFIYSLFFPLKWQSSRKMKKAQKYAPRMKELQEKLKGMKQSDPRMKELQMEQLRLMKEANPLGRMSAFADSDAVSVCALQRDHHLDRFSPGVVPVDSRSVGTRTLFSLFPARPADSLHRLDGRFAVADARSLQPIRCSAR